MFANRERPELSACAGRNDAARGVRDLGLLGSESLTTQQATGKGTLWSSTNLAHLPCPPWAGG